MSEREAEPMGAEGPDALRTEMRERWDTAATGWGKRADRIRQYGMPVSMWMIEHLALQPGQRVLELAAGPGDTGFLAAELVKPGGTLISSDGSEGMLEVARERAAGQGIDNVEFKRLELEWIDLPTADVDAVLCRWGLMLSLDPEAAAREMRRVLRPGGRVAVAVWDDPAENPWATIPGRALIARGLSDPPDPSAPGMFALAAPGALQEVLEAGGFVDVAVEPVELPRRFASAEDFLTETLDMSQMFSGPFRAAPEEEQTAVRDLIGEGLARFTAPDGAVVLPARTLAAVANA